DDRDRSQPWGILGGQPGAMSSKELIRTSGERIKLPSKISQVTVRKGDQLSYHTAGGGGWKDPLDPPAAKVRLDVIRGLVSIEKAEEDYGVVLDRETMEVDEAESASRRDQVRKARGKLGTFTFGPVPEPIGVVKERARSATSNSKTRRTAAD